jgi:hypothetical protein
MKKTPDWGGPSRKHDNQSNSEKGVYASNRHAETKLGRQLFRLEAGLLAAHSAFPTLSVQP